MLFEKAHAPVPAGQISEGGKHLGGKEALYVPGINPMLIGPSHDARIAVRAYNFARSAACMEHIRVKRGKIDVRDVDGAHALDMRLDDRVFSEMPHGVISDPDIVPSQLVGKFLDCNPVIMLGGLAIPADFIVWEDGPKGHRYRAGLTV